MNWLHRALTSGIEEGWPCSGDIGSSLLKSTDLCIYWTNKRIIKLFFIENRDSLIIHNNLIISLAITNTFH